MIILYDTNMPTLTGIFGVLLFCIAVVFIFASSYIKSNKNFTQYMEFFTSDLKLVSIVAVFLLGCFCSFISMGLIGTLIPYDETIDEQLINYVLPEDADMAYYVMDTNMHRSKELRNNYEMIHAINESSKGVYEYKIKSYKYYFDKAIRFDNEMVVTRVLI